MKIIESAKVAIFRISGTYLSFLATYISTSEIKVTLGHETQAKRAAVIGASVVGVVT